MTATLSTNFVAEFIKEKPMYYVKLLTVFLFFYFPSDVRSRYPVGLDRFSHTMSCKRIFAQYRTSSSAIHAWYGSFLESVLNISTGRSCMFHWHTSLLRVQYFWTSGGWAEVNSSTNPDFVHFLISLTHWLFLITRPFLQTLSENS